MCDWPTNSFDSPHKMESFIRAVGSVEGSCFKMTKNLVLQSSSVNGSVSSRAIIASSNQKPPHNQMLMIYTSYSTRIRLWQHWLLSLLQWRLHRASHWTFARMISVTVFCLVVLSFLVILTQIVYNQSQWIRGYSNECDVEMLTRRQSLKSRRSTIHIKQNVETDTSLPLARSSLQLNWFLEPCNHKSLLTQVTKRAK